MKDVVLIGPILIAGGTLLASLGTSSWHNTNPHQTQELVFLAFLFGLLYAWHRGKQVTAERIRAMELGWNLPEPRPQSSSERTTVLVSVWMPVGLVGLAWLASSVQPNLSTQFWSVACLLGMTALICGTVRSLHLLAFTSAGEPNVPGKRLLKTKTDPDEFDVVGQRGSNGLPTEERF